MGTIGRRLVDCLALYLSLVALGGLGAVYFAGGYVEGEGCNNYKDKQDRIE